ncbi:MAG: hypothetical protein U1E67_01250 [Hyphomicrobiales bacterium]
MHASDPNSAELRADKVLARAKVLFRDENPGHDWPMASDLAQDDQLMRVQARYLQRAEQDLLKAGTVESIDQT